MTHPDECVVLVPQDIEAVPLTRSFNEDTFCY